MVQNFPGPYEIRLRYTTDGFTHTARYNCFVVGNPVPGTPSSEVDVTLFDASTQNIETALGAFLALLQGVFSDQTSFDSAELWEYAPGTTQATFITAWNVGLTGNLVEPPVIAGQQTMTFRTLEGNIMRLVFLEAVAVTNNRVDPTFEIQSYLDIIDYVVGDSGWIIGRDTSFPIAYIRRSGGQNEALFRRRYRP